MALSEFEQKRCEKIVGAFIQGRRPRAHIRPKLDLGFRATLVKSTGAWRVYWQRADLKWHRYGPAPEVGTLEEFVTLVGEDAHACFWG